MIQRVFGEIYEVDMATHAVLDKLEDCPDHYQSYHVHVKMVRDPNGSDVTDTKTRPITCLVYAVQNFRPEMLDRPMFDDYDSGGSHGTPYISHKEYDKSSWYAVVKRPAGDSLG